MSNPEIRVRIAPSPSGNLHVGTARTALFNYLFAKKNNGKFILRIEDTDKERSFNKYIQNIYDSLKAMGLNWDEGPDVGGDYGPYTQSERSELYKQYAKQLMESGHAYECWCTQEELEAEKEQAIKEKRDYKYSKKCKNITPEQIEQYKAEGRKPVIRFEVPTDEEHKQIKFYDVIKGEINFDADLIGDFVMMKSNGTPSYNFAVVVDDSTMKISHVIRGEDHISNTPKQIMIYQALGVKVPKFAHAGMILAPDKSKLSKRHGATAVSDYIAKGYLSEAFVNFLALLGWAPSDGQEIMKLTKLIDKFSLKKVSPSPTIFEFDKLNWMNGQYLRALDIKDAVIRLKPYLSDYDLSIYTDEQVQKMVEIVVSKLTVLEDIKEHVSYLFGDSVKIEEDIQKDVLDTEESQSVLPKFLELTDSIDFANFEDVHEKLDEFRNAMKPLKPKQTMWAIRAALTGRVQGADINEVIALLGKDRVQQRVKASIK